MASSRRQRSVPLSERTELPVGSTSSRTPGVPGAKRDRPKSDGRRRWSSRILGIAGAAALLIGLVAWRVLPAIGGNQPAISAQPVAKLNAPDVHSLLVDPTDPDHVLFGSHAGIQESRDGGFTWQAGALQNADAMSIAASANDPATVLVAGHDVFLASHDSGATWQPVAHDLPGTDIHAFAQDPDDPRRLYALVVGAGVLTSADGGATWDALPAQPPGVGGHGALASDGTALYAATAEGLVRSPDAGTTWERRSAPPSGMVLSLATAADGSNTLYAGTESGSARSTDGGTSWDELGPNDIPVLALAVAPSDSSRVLIVDDTGAVYRSDDGGASWMAPR